MDTQNLLEKPAVEPDAVHHVGHAQACPRDRRGRVRVAQHLIAKRHAVLARLYRVIAMDQLGKIELKLVSVPRRVGALHLAQLALKASVHHLPRFGSRDLAHVTIVAFIDEAKQRGERIAVLEAHATAVTHLEDTGDLLIQPLLVPVPRLTRVVAEPWRWLVRNSALFGHGRPSIDVNERSRGK